MAWGIAAPFPSRPGRKGPRKRECIWRRAAAEPRLEIPRDVPERGGKSRGLTAVPKAGLIKGCMSGKEKVPGMWLWLNRRNKAERKDVSLLGLTPNVCGNSYFC